MVEYKFISYPRSVAIIGVPFSGGQARAGVDEGPNRMLDYGLISQVKELGWEVHFDGKLHKVAANKLEHDPDIGVLKNPRQVSKVTQTVANQVENHAKQGRFALTLGGDHSLAIGTITGTGRVYEDLCVIWVDAHADINTPKTTNTGNLHGCPVSFLMGIAGKVESFEWLVPKLTPDRLVYIGLRDVDEAEKRILKQYKIKAFSMYEVDKYGIGKVVEMALDYVNPNRDRPIHLSFDVDALDPSVAPATGTPVRGGLTFREGHFVCEAIAATRLLVALDLMEVNPMLGDAKSLMETVTVGCSLIRSCMGETLL